MKGQLSRVKFEIIIATSHLLHVCHGSNVKENLKSNHNLAHNIT